MNERVANILAQHFLALNFISKTAGCVQPLTLNGETFPAARPVYENLVEGECAEFGDYRDLTPNTDELGVLYFEDGGCDNLGGDNRKETWTGRLKLVCWLNLKLIGYQQPGQLIEAVMSNMLTDIPNDGFFIGGKLQSSRVLPKTPHPFAQYSYNEARNQFLMYPFEYFSIELKYRIMVMRNCPTTITLNPAAC